MTTGDETLERMFAAIARAVDTGGPDPAATLARLCLLLARELADPLRVEALAMQAAAADPLLPGDPAGMLRDAQQEGSAE